MGRRRARETGGDRLDRPGVHARPAATSSVAAVASAGPGKPSFIITFPSWASSATATIISFSPAARAAGRGPTSTSFARSWPRRCVSCSLIAAGGRRRLRLRGQSPLRPRRAWRAHDHSRQARSPHHQARRRPLSSTDASPLRSRRLSRRAQVETVISMIKRRQGAYVRGRSYHSQCRDLRLMVLTHNVMILWRRGFLQSRSEPFLPTHRSESPFVPLDLASFLLQSPQLASDDGADSAEAGEAPPNRYRARLGHGGPGRVIEYLARLNTGDEISLSALALRYRRAQRRSRIGR